MSQRWILAAVLVLGVGAALFFFRAKEDGSSSNISSSEEESPKLISEVPSVNSPAEPSTLGAENKKPSSDSPASPLEPSSFHGRSINRGDRPVGGAKSFDSSQARWRDDVALEGTPWKIWEGVSAYPKANGEPPATGRRLGEINGYYLVQENFSISTQDFDGRPIVVLNPKENLAGVLTGSYGVTLEEGASADFLSSDSEVKMLADFPAIATYYVTSSQTPFDLRVFLEKLRAQPEVKSVHLEILSRQNEKQ